MHDRPFEADAPTAPGAHREGPAGIQAATRAEGSSANPPDPGPKTEVSKPLHEGAAGVQADAQARKTGEREVALQIDHLYHPPLADTRFPQAAVVQLCPPSRHTVRFGL
jgi:hypothetical protein